MSYASVYTMLQQQESIVRSLIEVHKEIVDRHERGALAERARRTAEVLNLYAEILITLYPDEGDNR